MICVGWLSQDNNVISVPTDAQIFALQPQADSAFERCCFDETIDLEIGKLFFDRIGQPLP